MAQFNDAITQHPGQAVLDLCCGAGASAIPAARAVGPLGRVVGVDVAAPLLESARARAATEGLGNIAFRDGDARSTGLPNASFDCVICVFGVFFASDMPASMAEMWRLVRPSGRLAVTTWGPGLFEPANGIFWGAVRRLQPRMFKAFNPWDEITTPTALRSLFGEPGSKAPYARRFPGSIDSTLRRISGTWSWALDTERPLRAWPPINARRCVSTCSLQSETKP